MPSNEDGNVTADPPVGGAARDTNAIPDLPDIIDEFNPENDGCGSFSPDSIFGV
jgi:hypothetical protein